ncbi:MAG: tetratricopeptide repeat protein [Deltaproteobacteria bacterium]|nr:tetratricopeptide repeat protein [Deltaproteobacteria bacterium]
MSKEKVIESAEKYFQAGKYDRAIKEYQKLLAEDPSDMRVKLKVGDILAKKKDTAKAVEVYREVADIFSKEDFHLKAIAVYKTILKLSPTATDVNEKLGDLYHKIGLDSDALNQYYIVTNYYDGKGMIKEVGEIRKKIVEIEPSSATARIRLAEVFQAEGKAEDSLREYEKAAELMTKRKDRDNLIEVYEKVLYFKPQNTEMLLKLCKIYFEKRDFKKALRRLESSPPAAQKDPQVLEAWAEALLEDRQVDASRRKFRDLYQQVLETKKADQAARVYSRILQEFGDDQDYLKELDEMRKTAGVPQQPVAPKYRQDFEKTDIIDLTQIDDLLKKK